MAKNWSARFTGNNQAPGQPVHPDALREPEPYSASEELKRAVNLAIFLGRPLLLEGEAGCGKTRLACAVAYELELPFFPWQIRSTSKAQDGLYLYDSLRRLHDVQLGERSERDPGKAALYCEPGPLGEAFRLKECPGVVLIDEIDKADLDFPNDLLSVLDQPWEFEIKETGEKVAATYVPIVIITSNKEKGNLPLPFLRRCVYFEIKFPDEETLKDILRQHLPGSERKETATLRDLATDRFLKLRREGNLSKKPGTSEYLDWMGALLDFDQSSRAQLEQSLGEERLPYRELLIKMRPDWAKTEGQQ
jgi:MoxR-like ATPase